MGHFKKNTETTLRTNSIMCNLGQLQNIWHIAFIELHDVTFSSYGLFIETIVRRLHKTVCHFVLTSLPACWDGTCFQMSTNNGQIIKDTIWRYLQCQCHSQASRHFKFNLLLEVGRNHTVLVEIFYFDGAPIFHVADHYIYYLAECRLATESVRAIICPPYKCFVNIYLLLY